MRKIKQRKKQEIERKRTNFKFHGKCFKFAKYSLNYFDEENAFRCRLIWIMTSRSFENFMNICVLINSLLLCFYDYSVRIEADKEIIANNQRLRAVYVFFLIIFTFEVIIKIIAQGFKFYINDFWQSLQFFIVIIQYSSTFTTNFKDGVQHQVFSQTPPSSNR